MEETPKIPEPILFTSHMERRETLLVLLWLPIHLVLLPALAAIVTENGWFTAAEANLLLYAVSAVYIVTAEFGFLRREFDPFCDRKLYCILQVLTHYLLMLAMNLAASALVSWIETLFGNGVVDNRNNDTIIELAGREMNIMAAMTVFLAPVVEEVIFRGGLFCSLRVKNRKAAYLISVLAFALYHVWSYAILDPHYWIYLLQYLPAGYLLCRCYERTNSIWCSIFFHMLTNHIALDALTALEGML